MGWQFTKRTSFLPKLTLKALKLSKEDATEISFECVNRMGKASSTDSADSKPRPLIAKLMYHQGKKLVLAEAKNLRGTSFAIDHLHYDVKARTSGSCSKV